MKRPGRRDQRQHERFDLALPIQFEFNARFYDVFSVNISEGGMFVDISTPPPQEESLWFRIWLGPRDLEGTRYLDLKGTVVHLGPQIGMGMGIRFDHVDDNAAELTALADFLEQQVPPAPATPPSYPADADLSLPPELIDPEEQK